MRARHWTTLGVFLVALALLSGIYLRLRSAEGEGEGAATGDAAADSVRRAVQSTAAQTAFATEMAVPVEGALVRRDTFVIWVNASGEAAALRSAPLQAEVAGPVLQVPVREGQAVSKNHVLVRIDPMEFELKVKEEQARVDEAQARFEELGLGDERIEDPELRRERRRLARVRSQLPAAEAALERAKYDLSKATIRAPFAGRVANLTVVQGSRLREGDSVAVVLDLSRVDVDVEVQETDLPYVEVGREARATFPALPGEEFTGRVVTVNPLVSRESRTARVTVRLVNPEARMHSGMYANVRIAGRLLADRTFVPKSAIVERDRRDVVFVFAPDEAGSKTGRAKWTYVTRGLENDRFVEIVPGEQTEVPEANAVVLVDGHATLVHDARVEIENLSELEGHR
ncbi:MAG: efflux RND transporter periplasmic adaptor subunit [Gemmatimonadota bacterium]